MSKIAADVCYFSGILLGIAWSSDLKMWWSNKGPTIGEREEESLEEAKTVFESFQAVRGD